MRTRIGARRRHLWAEILGLAAACFGAGQLAWSLSDAPGRAVALWPAAGLAVGLALVRGLGLSAGAALGAFGLALAAFLRDGGSLGVARAALAAGGISAGVGVQTAVAALAVRSLVSGPLPLGRTGELARFALLAGVGPALLGAAVWTGGMLWTSLVTLAQAPACLLVWWVGNLLGIIVFAPVILMVGAPAQVVGWRRRLTVSVPALLATALAVALFVQADRWDQRRARTVLDHRVDAIAAAAERSLAFHLDALRVFADVLGGSARMDAAGFQRMATGAMARRFSFEALAWAPAPLARKPIVVEVAEPSSAAPLLLGRELAPDDRSREQAAAARQSGQPFAVSLPAPAPRAAIALVIPAPGPDGEHGVVGFVAAVLRVDRMLDRAVGDLVGDGVGFELRDPAAGGPVLHRLGPTGDVAGREVRMAFGNRTLVLAPVMARTALAAQRSAQVWTVLVAAMLFVVLLEAILLVASAAREEYRPWGWG